MSMLVKIVTLTHKPYSMGHSFGFSFGFGSGLGFHVDVNFGFVVMVAVFRGVVVEVV